MYEKHKIVIIILYINHIDDIIICYDIEFEMISLRYMFLDESGDLGLKGSNYLVIAALVIKKPDHLDQIIKNMRRNKFKKELKDANEIKANKSSKAVRKHVIKQLNSVTDAQVYCVVYEKHLNDIYLQNDKHKLYNCVAGALAKQINIQDSYIIRIDKSKGKQILRQDFDDYFLENLKKGTEIGNVKIYHSYSHSWSGLQFADMIAWSYFQKFERKNSYYIDMMDLDCNLFEL